MRLIQKTLITAAVAGVCGAAMAVSLPQIAVLATGGTIAGSGASATGSAYSSGKVSVNHLVAAVPQLADIAEVTPKQIVQIGSQDMTDDVWLKLAKTINTDCRKYDGFVITHGTDTMEETAYFLNLTVKCKKPVVLVGAMLPSTGLGADGPRNLYNAVLTAATKETAKQGVVVAMNNIVVGARDMMKSNTVQPETFVAANFGKVGIVSTTAVWKAFWRRLWLTPATKVSSTPVWATATSTSRSSRSSRRPPRTASPWCAALACRRARPPRTPKSMTPSTGSSPRARSTRRRPASCCSLV